MSLAISSGYCIQLIVEGNDENQAIDELANFIEKEGISLKRSMIKWNSSSQKKTRMRYKL